MNKLFSLLYVNFLRPVKPVSLCLLYYFRYNFGLCCDSMIVISDFVWLGYFEVSYTGILLHDAAIRPSEVPPN